MPDYHAESLSAAFLAFVDAGGDPDRADGFDWEGRHAELVQRGRLHLRQALRGGGTRYADTRLREGKRLSLSSCHTWHAWSSANPQERDLARKQLDDLE